MTEAGLKVIGAAKRDGSWNRLDDVEELRLPEDLERALTANKSAQSNFDELSKSFKKQILWWVESAKKPETRLRRIRQTVDMAAQGKKVMSSE